MEKEPCKILFVDDEENILGSMRRLMIGEPYICHFANSGEEALRLMKSIKMDIVISDMKMPSMTGLELMKQIKELYPDTVKIILSGYAQITQVIATVNQIDLFKFLLKPWKNEEIIQVLKESEEYLKSIEQRKQMLSDVEKKKDMYQKLMQYKELEVSGLIDDINSIKIISEKIIQDIKFFIVSENPNIAMKFISLIEKLFNVYNVTIPTINQIYTIDDISTQFKGIYLKRNIDTNTIQYKANIILIKYIFSEFINYCDELIGLNNITVEFDSDNGVSFFRFWFKIGDIQKENYLLLKIFPKYISYLNLILKQQGWDLKINTNTNNLEVMFFKTQE